MDHCELTTEPIDISRVARREVPEECGATVTLDGYVRRFTKGRERMHLVYEAYEPMALKEMQKLAERSRSEFEISNVSIVHRLVHARARDPVFDLGCGPASEGAFAARADPRTEAHRPTGRKSLCGR